MFANRTVVALVPIKDHSELVAWKDFRLFAGKPLYHHIIHTLDRVYRWAASSSTRTARGLPKRHPPSRPKWWFTAARLSSAATGSVQIGSSRRIWRTVPATSTYRPTRPTR